MATDGLALRPPSMSSVKDAQLPATYEHARTALAACDRLDECKDWADKAAALASYAKQADDQSLHQLATRISARAIRRAGDLLQEFQSPGGRPPKTRGDSPPSFTQREAAEAAGMSKDQEKQAVRVARVPAETFETLVESDAPPTISTLAELGTATKQAKVAPPGFADATLAIDAVRQFAVFCAEHPAETIARGTYPYERARIKSDVAAIGAWFVTFTNHLDQEA